MINFHSLSSISEGKHQRTVRKVKESGNIRRVFLTVSLSGKLTNGTGNRKMQSSFLFVCAQTALTLRARARVHVISNGTIFLQHDYKWKALDSLGLRSNLHHHFFFSFIEFIREECILLFKEYIVFMKFVNIYVTFRYCYK